MMEPMNKRTVSSEKGSNSMAGKELLRPREVAERLAVSRSTVYRWFWEGKLQGVRLSNRSLRILKSSVEEKLAEVW